MNPPRIVLILLAAVAGGAVLGALIGWIAGSLSPGFVEGILGRGATAWGQPGLTGLALGLVNGAIMGFLGGALIVLVAAFGRRG